MSGSTRILKDNEGCRINILGISHLRLLFFSFSPFLFLLSHSAFFATRRSFCRRRLVRQITIATASLITGFCVLARRPPRSRSRGEHKICTRAYPRDGRDDRPPVPAHSCPDDLGLRLVVPDLFLNPWHHSFHSEVFFRGIRAPRSHAVNKRFVLRSLAGGARRHWRESLASWRVYFCVRGRVPRRVDNVVQCNDNVIVKGSGTYWLRWCTIYRVYIINT